MLHVSTQKQSSSFRHTWVLMTKHLQKFFFGSVQRPCESPSCASPLQLSYPHLKGVSKGSQYWGAKPLALPRFSFQPWQHRGPPHNNPVRCVQLLNCKSLALAPNIGLRIWCRRNVEPFLGKSFLACSLPSSPVSFLLYLFAFLFLSPLDVQLPDSNSSSSACSQYSCGFPSIKLRSTFCPMFSAGSVRGRFKCHKVRHNDFLGH